MDLEGILQAGKGYGADLSMAADPVGLVINYSDNKLNKHKIDSKYAIPTFASSAHKTFNPDLKNYKSTLGKLLGAGTTVAGLGALALTSPRTNVEYVTVDAPTEDDPHAKQTFEIKTTYKGPRERNIDYSNSNWYTKLEPETRDAFYDLDDVSQSCLV